MRYTKIFCSSGIACEHPEPIWREKNVEVVENEKQSFGCIKNNSK
jgi:hypothetical protein